MAVMHARAASPVDLDTRRQLSEARAELAARVDQESALREHMETLGRDLTFAELRYAEMHVAYLELLVHARAEVAEQRSGTACRAGYLAGHLEEIGLEPAADMTPDQLVAEGLALAARLRGGDE